MLSQTTYLRKITDFSTAKDVSFSMIFQKIKSNDLKTIKNNLLKLSGEQRTKYKVYNLPAFFPNLWLRGQENKLSENDVPTGLVQFDIDLKDNSNLNEVKNKLLLIKELMYLFESPNNGLKLALKTDFYRLRNESIKETKDRFRIAYDIVKAYLLESVNVQFDDAIGHLKSQCFLSYDPNAYFNDNCESFKVNDRCFSAKMPKEPFLQYSTIDVNYIEDVLYKSDIPRNLNINDRFNLSSAVFNAIGPAAKSILKNFYEIDSEKLKEELDSLSESKNRAPLSIGFLLHFARKYSYPKTISGRARNKLTTNNIVLDANRIGQIVETLKTYDEAQEEIKTAVNQFLETKEDMIISSSVGIGKSETVLQVLKRIPWTVRVLYVSSNHELLYELEERFQKMKYREKGKYSYSSIDHIEGKQRLCEEETLKKEYGSIAIPYKQCYQCVFQANCRYTEQFKGMGNIRLAVFDELFNDESYFDNWKPQIIIIDESCIKIETFQEDLTCFSQAIKNIILCAANMPLKEAIDKHFSDVMKDYSKMNKKVTFENKEQYLNDIKKIKSSEILKTIRNYLISYDEDDLKGLRLCSEKLRLSRIRSINERYANVPKLFLDATANEKIIKHLYPSIIFKSIHAIKRDTTRLIQAENFNLTKSKLEKNIDKIVAELKNLVKDYENVGLITFKNLKSIKNFDEWLGKEINASVVDHFGNIRGKNTFANVDCLLVVGRHLIDRNSLDDWSYALFNKAAPSIKDCEAVLLPVRMKDQWKSLENYVYVDEEIENLKNHLCHSETLQAIGRSRWFNDKKKVVYLLSNEVLGTNYVVDEWLRYDQLKIKINKTKEEIEEDRIKKISETRSTMENEKKMRILEYRDFPNVKDNKEAFCEIGFSERFSKSKKERHEFMKAASYKLTNGVWSLNIK